MYPRHDIERLKVIGSRTIPLPGVGAEIPQIGQGRPNALLVTQDLLQLQHFLIVALSRLTANNQWLTKYIAAPVKVTGIVCEVTLDETRSSNWIKYNTVAINQVDNDPKSNTGCGGVNLSFPVGLGERFNLQLPGKGFGGFYPVEYAGQEATFVGMLQNGASKSGKTLFWTAVVRRTSDVCLKPRAECP